MYSISPLFLFCYFIIIFILGVYIGGKRRIGSVWSIFFMLFWLLPGLVIMLVSPSKNKLPPEKNGNKVWDIVLGILFCLMAIGSFKSGMDTDKYFNRSSPISYEYVLSAFFIGSAIYVFRRKDRNNRMYREQQNPELKKKILRHDGMPPPPEDLDIPIYDQV